MTDFSDLSNDDLGALMEATAAAMAEISRQGAAIAGGESTEARRLLVETHERRWTQFKVQYDALCAELDRRHPQ